jgi:hypothetical protein
VVGLGLKFILSESVLVSEQVAEVTTSKTETLSSYDEQGRGVVIVTSSGYPPSLNIHLGRISIVFSILSAAYFRKMFAYLTFCTFIEFFIRSSGKSLIGGAMLKTV